MNLPSQPFFVEVSAVPRKTSPHKKPQLGMARSMKMLHTILLSLLLLHTCSAMEGTTSGSGTWQHHGGQWWSGSDGSNKWSGGDNWRGGGWKEKRWCDEEEDANDSEWVMTQVEEDKKKDKKTRKKDAKEGAEGPPPPPPGNPNEEATLPPPPPPPSSPPPKDMLPQEWLDEQAHAAIKLITDTHVSASAEALAAADKKKQKRAAQKAKKALSNAVTAAISVPGEEKEQPPKTTAEKNRTVAHAIGDKGIVGCASSEHCTGDAGG